MNVLLVEDEARIASFLAKGLRRQEHRVDVVGVGLAAVGALTDSESDHDVLVLDLPTIVVTARTGGSDQARARDLGVTDYLVTPFPVTQLLAIVARLDPRHGRTAPIR